MRLVLFLAQMFEFTSKTTCMQSLLCGKDFDYEFNLFNHYRIIQILFLLVVVGGNLNFPLHVVIKFNGIKFIIFAYDPFNIYRTYYDNPSSITDTGTWWLWALSLFFFLISLRGLYLSKELAFGFVNYLYCLFSGH